MGATTTALDRLDPEAIAALLDRVLREVHDGLLPAAQIAVALDGKVVVSATYGASDTTRFIPYSATKVLTVAAIWRLIADADLDVSRNVASYLPGFDAHDKGEVTVEQVMLHTGGFPMAPLGPREWRTHERRLAAYATWRHEFPPGARYVYHPVSAHWVLCDIIETVTGEDYRAAIHRLVTEPLGLPRLLGIPLDEQDGIAEVVGVGEPATTAELAAEFGDQVGTQPAIPADLVLFALTSLNHPKAREQGVPGGGAVVHAADMALLYQGLLHNPDDLWDPAVLADGTGHVRSRLPDPSGVPANRTLGLVVAGDDGGAPYRGFGTASSPYAFGHNGAGGQLAFADPASGLSACYVTSGLDQNLVREHRRNVEIADAIHALIPRPS
jgi:CubicO group peptidase (beta-lactamase class C family)